MLLFLKIIIIIQNLIIIKLIIINFKNNKISFKLNNKYIYSL